MVKKKKVVYEEGILPQNKYESVDFLSFHQFAIKIPYWLPSGYGKEFTISSFQVGTTYIDSASIVIWIENQVSLGYGETIMGKLKFE